MMFEGNIEQLTFYAIGELLYLFSPRFSFKIMNICAIFIFWLILFSSLGAFFWFKASYKKKASYLMEEYRGRSTGLFAITLDRGLFCLIFGVAHRILLKEPSAQLLVLGAI